MAPPVCLGARGAWQRPSYCGLAPPRELAPARARAVGQSPAVARAQARCSGLRTAFSSAQPLRTAAPWLTPRVVPQEAVPVARRAPEPARSSSGEQGLQVRRASIAPLSARRSVGSSARAAAFTRPPRKASAVCVELHGSIWRSHLRSKVMMVMVVAMACVGRSCCTRARCRSSASWRRTVERSPSASSGPARSWACARRVRKSVMGALPHAQRGERNALAKAVGARAPSAGGHLQPRRPPAAAPVQGRRGVPGAGSAHPLRAHCDAPPCHPHRSNLVPH